MVEKDELSAPLNGIFFFFSFLGQVGVKSVCRAFGRAAGGWPQPWTFLSLSKYSQYAVCVLWPVCHWVPALHSLTMCQYCLSSYMAELTCPLPLPLFISPFFVCVLQRCIFWGGDGSRESHRKDGGHQVHPQEGAQGEGDEHRERDRRA